VNPSRIKPLRVVLAIAFGLAGGLWLVRLMTPPPADGAAPEETPIATAPPVGAPHAPAPVPSTGLRASQQTLEEKFPRYPNGGAWVRLGERLEADRMPMSVVSFETKDSDDKVLAFYARHFEANGIPWQGVRESLKQVGVPAVSGTDEVGDLQLTVLAFPHEGGTTVMLAAADMKTFYDRVNADAPEDEGELPRYPGSQSAVVRTTEGGRDGMMISLATKDSVEQVEAFYRSTLPRQGFTELAAGDGPRRLMHQLDFSAPDRSWRFFLASTKNGTAVTAQGQRGTP
jgi:hypothetical protein